MAKLTHKTVSYCEIAGDLDEVPKAAALLKTFCENRLIDPVAWQSIELGFCEALNNAVEHGCREDPAKTVKISWSWEGDLLSIEVEDPGTCEPYGEKPVALPEDPLAESGRGCFLIESSFDSVVHRSTEYGHKLVAKKRIHPPRNLLDKFQETYEALENVTGELNQSYAESAALQGFARDLSEAPDLAGAVTSGLARLKSTFVLPLGDVWVKQGQHLVNPLAPGDDALSIDGNSETSITQVFHGQNERIISDCGVLPKSDPLYSSVNSALLTPINYHNECVGVIAIQVPSENASQIETNLSQMARVFSHFLAISIVNATTVDQKKERERSRTQLEIASEIQRSLLPSSFPDNEYCRVTGKCVSAMAIGGDYIDAIDIKGHGQLLVIADVMGKGVPAALLATIFRTAIRSRLNLAETPGWLLSQINTQIHDELGHLNMFITAQAAYFSYEDRQLKLASAGHCPAFLTRNGKREPEEVTAEGLPLGIHPDDIYEECLLKLDTGDRVLFITDGIYEAENPSGEMLGIDGFSRRLPEIWQEGIEAVPENALSVVAVFSQGSAAQDDKTLLALEAR